MPQAGKCPGTGAQAADKLPAAPIFAEDVAQPWRRGNWAYELREAAKKVNEKARGKDRIPAGVGAYAFRHARISELLQIHGVDPPTVAAQTGISLAMIENAYPRFIPSAMRRSPLVGADLEFARSREAGRKVDL